MIFFYDKDGAIGRGNIALLKPSRRTRSAIIMLHAIQIEWENNGLDIYKWIINKPDTFERNKHSK